MPGFPRTVIGAALVAAMAGGGFIVVSSLGEDESPCGRIGDGLSAFAAEVAGDAAGLEKDAALAALDEGRAWVRDGCPADVYPGHIASGIALLEGMDVAAAPIPPGYSNVQGSPAFGTGR